MAVYTARGHAVVPVGFLSGLMRKQQESTAGANPNRVLKPAELALDRLIAAAPSKSREFHASDLRRMIGQAAYDARVLQVLRQSRCTGFAATSAVQGRAVPSEEIST